jgi:hypothetical protein
MKSARIAGIAAALAMAAASATLAGCGSQPATPAAAASPSATAPSSPAATPAAPQTPVPGITSQAPATRVVSSRVAYPWHWPNDVVMPGVVKHSYRVPPTPELVQIRVGDHAAEHAPLPYSRMSFTFTRAFPSYHFEWVSKLAGDASGKMIPLAGTDVLKIVFDQARAHSADGTRSTIVSQPGRPVGLAAMTDFAQAGDFEGVLSYGIGTTRAVLTSNPQTDVRAYEVETVTAAGQHRYIVAIDIRAAEHH